MLKRLHRITQKKDFDKFFGPKFRKSGGYSNSTPDLIIKSLKNRSEISRFAFVISTKVDKRATKRNLIKRRLREIVRARLPRISGGYDVLIIAQKGIADADFARLERDVDQIFRKLRLIVK
ncbi:MAG TPA: ribonuclease P protein component [Candidatus Bipolaricaulota bacterium]|nr:ribonuclease P protein component [Candidatus Bipolaricaulota bacterium]